MEDNWEINIHYNSFDDSINVLGKGISGESIYGSIVEFLANEEFSLDTSVEDIPNGIYNFKVIYSLNKKEYHLKKGDLRSQLAKKILLFALKEKRKEKNEEKI